VSLLALKAKSRGKAYVYIDGHRVKTIDTYSSTTRYRQIVYDKTFTTVGKHTILVKTLATSHRPRVDLDGIVVVNPDLTAPKATVGILSGAYTRSRDVSLAIVATDNVAVSQMQVSESSTFVGALWQPLVSTLPWTLSAGDGAKAVYARFIDAFGNTSNAFSAKVTLASSLVLSGGRDAQVTLGSSMNVTATVASGAPATVTLRYRPNGYGSFQSVTMLPVSGSLAATIPATALTGLCDYYLSATDVAGNTATSPSGAPGDVFTVAPVAVAPPSIPSTITGTPGDRRATLVWSAVTGSGLAGYRLYRSDSAAGPWTRIYEGSSTTAADTTILNGHAYYYSVSAYGTSGAESSRTAPAHVALPQKLSGLRITAPAGVTVSEPFDVTVTALDDNGDSYATYVGAPSITAIGGSGILTPSSVTGFVAGSAIVKATYSQPATVTLRVTDGARTATSTPVRVNASNLPAYITVSPGVVQLDRGTKQTYTAKGYTTLGVEVPITPTWSVVGSPAVGTIDAAGSLTTTRGGIGRVKATVGNVSAEVTVSVVTLASGTIRSDTVWTAEGSPYVVSGVDVAAGATLTVAAGAVVKFPQTAVPLSVYGTLLVQGTAQNRVYFTSLADDAVGGDTNGDGTASSPGMGNWGSINFGMDSNSSSFSHAVIRYGGRQGGWSSPDYGAVTNSSTTADDDPYLGSFDMNDSEVTDCLYAGVYLYAVPDMHLTNNLFARNGQAGYTFGAFGIHVSAAPTSAVSIDGCSFVDNPGLAVWGDSANRVRTQNCWWGDPSGPAPIGTGGGVSWHYEQIGSMQVRVLDVDVEPWVGQRTTQSASYGTSSRSSAYAAEPVNVLLGNYTYEHTDVSYGARGPKTTLSRSYNSLDASGSIFGAGWSSSLDVGLSFEAALEGGSLVVVRNEDGRRDSFELESGGALKAPAGVFDTLTRNGNGTYTLKRKDHTVLTFSASGQLTAVADSNGNSSVIARNGAGRPVTVTDCVGRVLTLTYNAAGTVSSARDPLGRTWTYTYDATTGSLAAVTDPMNRVTAFSYEQSGYLASIKDARGHWLVRNTYDDIGRVVSQLDAKSNTTTFAYYPGSQMTVMTDPLGAATRYNYDALFRLTSATDALAKTESYTYDAAGNRSSVTNKRGFTTTYAYDTRGNLTKRTDALDGVTSSTYDARDNLTSVTDPLGRTSHWVFDSSSNLTSSTDASGAVSTLAYTAFGQIASATDPLGNTTAYAYDARGNKTSATDELGNASTFVCDVVGRLISASDPLGNTTATTYNADDEILAVAAPLSRTTSATYDAAGNKTSSTDAAGKRTSWTYDEKDQLTGTLDAAGGTAAAVYDANGNRTSTTDPNGHVTTRGYDALGRVTSETDALGRSRSNTYDGNGNVVTSMDAKGQRTTYTYDALDRLITVSYADGTTVSTTHDAAGQKTSVTDAAGTWHYRYDATGRVLSTTDPSGRVTMCAYDLGGHRVRLVYPSGAAAVSRYDAAGRLWTVTDWSSKITTYTYDAASRTTKVARGNGGVTTYAVNGAGEITGQTERSAVATLSVSAWTYNSVGNRLTQTDPSGVTSYTYDALHRLTRVGYPGGRAVSYVYDPCGNRESMTDTTGGTTAYTYDAANQMTSAGAATYTYDANGSVVSRTGTGATTYAWDAKGRLASAGSTSFAYSGDGSRASKTSGAVTTVFSYDPAAALSRVVEQGVGSSTTDYLYGNGLLGQSTAGGVDCPLQDAHGSVVQVAQASGGASGRVAYDAFGATGDASLSPFMFSGEQLDTETGLYYLRARYYDPTTGRFISRDANPGDIADTQSMNRYEYCANNPVNLSDRSGNTPVDDMRVKYAKMNIDALKTWLSLAAKDSEWASPAIDRAAEGLGVAGSEMAAAEMVSQSVVDDSPRSALWTGTKWAMGTLGGIVGKSAKWVVSGFEFGVSVGEAYQWGEEAYWTGVSDAARWDVRTNLMIAAARKSGAGCGGR